MNRIRLAVLSMVIGLYIGIFFGALVAKKKYTGEAIENKAAYYDPTTGNFTWGSMNDE